MKKREKKNVKNRVSRALQLSSADLRQQAAAGWQITDKELRELCHQAVTLPIDARRGRRHTRLRVAAVVVLVFLPLGLVASSVAARLQPHPDGYKMNLGADRSMSVVSISCLMQNL